MKKILAFALCAVTIFGMTGCKKEDKTTKLERQLTQQLLDAQYLDGTIDGSAKVNISNMGEQTIVLNGNIKVDKSSGFPHLKIDGTFGLQDLMSLPLTVYINDNQVSTTLFGQTQNYEMTEDNKNKVKSALELSSQNHADLARTVKETTYNDQRALEMHYDINQLNTLMSASGQNSTNIEQLTLYYLLGEDDSLQAIIVHLIINNNQRMDINVSLKLNSLNQPLDVNPTAQTDS